MLRLPKRDDTVSGDTPDKGAGGVRDIAMGEGNEDGG